MGSDLCRELMPWSDQAMLVKVCMVVIMGDTKEPLGADLPFFWRFAGSNCAFTGFPAVQI